MSRNQSTTPSWPLRLLWLRILILGGNYGYAFNDTWYAGWRPNILRLTLKFRREGWGKAHGNGQYIYTWSEFCWRLNHE